MTTRALPLHQTTVTDLFTPIYVYVDDDCKAAVSSGVFTLPEGPHQKASCAELMTTALADELLGQPYRGLSQRWLPLYLAFVQAMHTIRARGCSLLEPMLRIFLASAPRNAG